MEAETVNFFSVVVAPAATAIIGWLGSSYRNKQKKEGDILENFKQMRSIQDDFIATQKRRMDEQEQTIIETKAMNKRLETKLDKKEVSIRKAILCKHSSDGEGCPVLVNEDRNCEDCTHHDKVED